MMSGLSTRRALHGILGGLVSVVAGKVLPDLRRVTVEYVITTLCFAGIMFRRLTCRRGGVFRRTNGSAVVHPHHHPNVVTVWDQVELLWFDVGEGRSAGLVEDGSVSAERGRL